MQIKLTDVLVYSWFLPKGLAIGHGGLAEPARCCHVSVLGRSGLII